MTEVDGRSSIKDDQDEDNDSVCTPCFEDNIREQAIKYCPECQEFLCTGCTRHHGRQRMSRSHKLVDKNEAEKSLQVAMTTKCLYHQDREIEMYCEEHDMVYCTKCIAINHRSCTGVTCLDGMTVLSDLNRVIERFKTEIITIKERLENTRRKTETNIKSVEKQRNDVISQIQGLAHDLMEHIQKFKREALEDVDANYTLVKGELETKISRISKVSQEIKEANGQLNEVDCTDVRKSFVQTKLIQHTVNDALKIMEQSEAKGCESLRFTDNIELKSFVISSTSLGSVQKVAESKTSLSKKSYKVSSQKEINIRMKKDTNPCYICDMCQLPNGTIILADHSNCRIKRLDDGFNIKDCCDLESYTTGICCTGYNEVAVKLRNNKVQFLSVGSSLSMSRDFSINDGISYGMTYFDGQMWVSKRNGIDIYNTSGTLLKSVNGQCIFKSIQQMTVSGNTLYLTDGSDGAVCFTRDGTMRRELRDRRLITACGICISNDGTVFISGYGSNNIMMFDKEGKCLGELVNWKFGLVKPSSLLFDNKRNCLVAACSPEKIIVYNI